MTAEMQKEYKILTMFLRLLYRLLKAINYYKSILSFSDRSIYGNRAEYCYAFSARCKREKTIFGKALVCDGAGLFVSTARLHHSRSLLVFASHLRILHEPVQMELPQSGEPAVCGPEQLSVSAARPELLAIVAGHAHLRADLGAAAALPLALPGADIDVGDTGEGVLAAGHLRALHHSYGGDDDDLVLDVRQLSRIF